MVMVHALAQNPNWLAVLLAALAALLWTYFRYKPNAQQAVNMRYNLPPNWTPRKYVGPARELDVAKRTPKGIVVYTRGFDRIDIPEFRAPSRKVRLRVSLPVIDEIWEQVRKTFVTGRIPGYPSFLRSDREAVEKLPDTLPVIVFRPTIWFDPKMRAYLSSKVRKGHYVDVVVYYRSVTTGIETMWEDLLRTEFRNTICLAIGRSDLIK